jgi:hypothetical protein
MQLSGIDSNIIFYIYGFRFSPQTTNSLRNSPTIATIQFVNIENLNKNMKQLFIQINFVFILLFSQGPTSENCILCVQLNLKLLHCGSHREIWKKIKVEFCLSNFFQAIENSEVIQDGGYW